MTELVAIYDYVTADLMFYNRKILVVYIPVHNNRRTLETCRVNLLRNLLA